MTHEPQRIREKALIEALDGLRQARGEDAAASAIVAFAACVEFIHGGGHGNITLAVKDYSVAPKVRIEYIRDASLYGSPWST